MGSGESVHRGTERATGGQSLHEDGKHHDHEVQASKISLFENRGRASTKATDIPFAETGTATAREDR